MLCTTNSGVRSLREAALRRNFGEAQAGEGLRLGSTKMVRSTFEGNSRNLGVKPPRVGPGALVMTSQKSDSGPPPRQVNSNPRLSFTAWLSFCLQPRSVQLFERMHAPTKTESAQVLRPLDSITVHRCDASHGEQDS